VAVIVGDWPRINAERTLETVAVIDGDRSLSWIDLDDRVNRLCHVLARLPGHCEGRRIGILADNSVEHLELMFAASRGKLIHTALNTRHSAAEMLAQIDDAGVDVLLVGDNYVDIASKLRDVHPDLHLIGLGRTQLGLRYEDLLAVAPSSPVPSHGDAEAVYSLVYTSGSTGEPKGLVVSSRNERAYGQSVAWTLELRHADRVLVVVPMFHRGGQFISMMCAQYGTPLTFVRSAAPEPILDAISRDRLTLTLLVPTILKGIVEVLEADSSRYDVSCLRVLMCGSAPLDTVLTQRLAQVLPADICQCAGMSEGGFTMAMTIDDYRQALSDPALHHRIASAGRVVPGFRVGIVDDNDAFVGDDVVGELVYQGDAFVRGYWNRPDASETAWRGGWFHSGDLGRRDSDGYHYYLGRLFGRIKTGAETVYAREVEVAFEGHDDVQEIAVVGIPDAHWGEAVTAAIVTTRDYADEPARDALEQELRSYVHEVGLGRYKIPKRIVFVDDIPKTATGKIAYGQVKDQLIASLLAVESA
jgi:acyl-CoA synthetase (AMP-forming)/AMP-acid ligase II